MCFITLIGSSHNVQRNCDWPEGLLWRCVTSSLTLHFPVKGTACTIADSVRKIFFMLFESVNK